MAARSIDLEGFFMWLKFLLALALVCAACGEPRYIPVVGPQGPPGIPGTMIYAVQLCAGVTPTYPLSFPEVAFCIDDKLYATYSALGGYSFELIPGTYYSNAIGSTCNVTVLPHCKIQ